MMLNFSFHRTCVILSIILFSISGGTANAQRRKKDKPVKKPDWIMSRPVDRNYYQGIGVAMVNNYTQGHVEEAKKKAMNDIISEISVQVKSSSVLQQIEQNDELNSMYQSLTRVTSENNIEGYELVDSWGDEKEYWVYYRLSKDLYYQNKKRKLDRAKNVASQYYESGKSALSEGEVGRAYQDYVKGLSALKEYLDEEITILTDKGQEYLVDALMYELIELNRNIAIVSTTDRIKVRLAKAVEEEVNIQVQYKGSGIQLDLRPYFSIGSGEVPSSLMSSKDGNASFKIQRVTGGENQQILEVSVDIETMTGEGPDQNLIAAAIRMKCAVPSAKINIEASKVWAYLEIEEDKFVKDNSESGFIKNIRNQLSDKAFEFSSQKENAEVLVKISVKAKKGEAHELKNLILYTSYIDLYIGITDQKTGNQVYYKGFSEVKGSRSGSFDLALKEAELVALDKFEKELLPEITNINLE